MRVQRFVLMLTALTFPAAALAADQKPASVFGLDKVWSMHLTIQPKEWERMQPTRGMGPFSRGGPNQPAARPAATTKDRKPRGMMGFDFEYVHADLDIDGTTYKNVGVRFKGNAGYATSQGRLKRPFKVHLSRFAAGQNFRGLKKITLNTNNMDPTCAREALSYQVYRALGVPCPRTAYARLTITIPGKYDKELAGLYTLVEPIDKTFLKDRFGSARGLLLKPEGVGALEHLGADWSAYERRYRPKTPASKKARQRLIDFTRLVQGADDQTFAREIGRYLDVDEFLRFLAGTVALSTMDSFIGLGHNYLLYLDPKTDKFVVLPWDLDLSFGVFMMMGSSDALADLSIRQPQTGRNRLIERLLADARAYAAYQGHLKKLLDKGFTAEGMKKDLAAINASIKLIREQEAKAAAARREPGGGIGAMFAGGPALDVFVAKRVASIRAQLAGKSKGTVPRGFGPGGFGGFNPAQFLVRPILQAADKNKDGKLSKEEVTAAAKALFKALDREDKGELDEKAVTAGLARLLPGPPRGPMQGGGPPRPMQGGPPRGGAPFGPPMPGGGMSGPLARAIVARAGKGGKVTEAGLVAAALKLFAEADRNKDGQIDERELGEGLGRLFPRPQFNPGMLLVGPILRGADKDKDGKLSKDELTAGAKALFKALDREGKGRLDEKAVAAGLDRLLPGPGGFGGPRAFPGPGAGLAKILVAKAGKDGMLTEAGLVAAAAKFLTEADKDGDGKLDGRELGEALGKLMPAPRFGPPAAPRPAERKEGGR